MNKRITLKNESKTTVDKATKGKLSSFHKLNKSTKRSQVVRRSPAKAKTNKILSA